MKASMLVEYLKEAVQKYGDLDVMLPTECEKDDPEGPDTATCVGYSAMHSDDGTEDGRPEYILLCDDNMADVLGPN